LIERYSIKKSSIPLSDPSLAELSESMEKIISMVKNFFI